MNRIDKRLFTWLFFAFIVATIVGTLSHEWGHFIVAKSFGYYARIGYAYTFFGPTKSSGMISPGNHFYILLGGPFQTMLTGTIGLVCLFILRKSFYKAQKLSFGQWTLIFVTLFWLRQTANLLTWSGKYLFTGRSNLNGDEIGLANYLQLPCWTMIGLSGIIGAIILIVVVFRFIPPLQRQTFIASGLLGGIAGYILWLILLGKYIIP